MKSLIFTTLFSGFLLAGNPYLSSSKSHQIAKAIDKMCPDTYCGGDMQFYTNKMVCLEDECTLFFQADGVSIFNDPKDVGILNNKIIAKTNEDISLFYSSYNIKDHEDNRYQAMEIVFDCTFKNLKLNRSLFDSDYDMFLSMTLDCIEDFEDTIYNW